MNKQSAPSEYARMEQVQFQLQLSSFSVSDFEYEIVSTILSIFSSAGDQAI